MQQKKICMVGGFAVGKTSLVQRFCTGLFSDRYLTTVGVKIDKAVVETGSGPMSLILWDLAGEDEFQSLQMSYLSGAHGLVFVIDQTRGVTREVVLVLQKRIRENMGEVPFVTLANKSDLEAQVSPTELGKLSATGLFRTSAKTGEQVMESFSSLAAQIVLAGGARLARRT